MNKHLLDYQARYRFFSRNEFGGSLIRSHPKSARYFSRKKSIHVVLRSRFGLDQLKTPDLKKILQRVSELFSIKIQEVKIEKSVIQLIIKGKKRESLADFFRVISGLIARRILNSERGKPSKHAGQFWIFRPFTRILLNVNFSLAFKKTPEMVQMGIFPSLPIINTS